VFFQNYLAAPIVLGLYVGWKVYTRDWRMWIPALEIVLITNDRQHISREGDLKEFERTWAKLPARTVRSLF
jgi:amino acid transporter